jgi:tRNA pseudouridine55 synthase
MRGADLSVFEVECGKGTYVRSLARDMGRDLGCYGHVAELRRTEVEPFTPEDLVTLAELEAAANPPKAGDAAETRGEAGEEARAAPRSFAALDALVVETGAALEFLPQVAVGDDAAVKIRLGNPVIIRGRDAPVEAAEACVTARGKLIAIGAIEAGMFKPRRVFTS